MSDAVVYRLKGWLEPVWRWGEEHPLAAVLLLSLLVRIPAVIWSKGFIHSDDYYDTVMIAWDWLVNGHWGENGYLRWRSEDSSEIGRFPLYTLFLWGVMKAHVLAGIRELNEMMYSIRFLHALISLVPVGATYAVVIRVTKDRRWAFWGALAAGFHFAMPFLGVRNLIEVVGGNIWMGALACVYIYGDKKNRSWLLWAGVLTGLAWMVRFQMAFAALPVPFLLWWQTRRWGTAVWYSLGVGVMLVLSGLVDWALLGWFGGSTITNLTINVGLDPLYDTIPFMYPAILLGMLLPPLAFVLAYLMGRPAFWKEHAVLVGSSAVFLVAHMMVANQQERFIFPMLSPFVLIAILALWHKYRDHGYIVRRQRLFRATVVAAGALNVLLLGFLLTAYGHRGLIEPVLRIREMKPDARVMFVQPEIRKYMPTEYGGTEMERWLVMNWEDLEGEPEEPFDYVVLYPEGENELGAYLDSARMVAGGLVLDTVFEPSVYDLLLHRLNPGHNPSYRAWVYRVAGGTRAATVSSY